MNTTTQQQENPTTPTKIFSEKLELSYELVKNNEELADIMTGYLYTVHEFSYAQIESNKVNNRQGKNRRTYTGDIRGLAAYMVEDDVDYIVDKQLDDLLINSLNVYLSDKHSLPESDRMASGVMNRVKAMIIMLFGTGQYDVIPRLNLPKYVKPYVKLAFEKIDENKEDALDDWIDYLETSGNEKLAEVVRSKGIEFWGSDTVNAQDIFSRNFQSYLKQIKDYDKTYQMYLHYRGQHMKMTRRVTMNKLYETFDMTEAQFDRGKRNFISELPHIFNENESSNLILKLIYEN